MELDETLGLIERGDDHRNDRAVFPFKMRREDIQHGKVR